MIKPIDEKIKTLRLANHLSQAELARRLHVTRASVNAWEMGTSKPSIDCLTDIALLFGVSTDYLLGLKNNSTIDILGLTPPDIGIISQLINRLKQIKINQAI